MTGEVVTDEKWDEFVDDHLAPVMREFGPYEIADLLDVSCTSLEWWVSKKSRPRNLVRKHVIPLIKREFTDLEE